MSQIETPTLEVCVDTGAGLRACQPHVDRIELCAALTVGGLTPSPGLIAAARDSLVPVHVMIRPHAGNFTYQSDEIAQCIADIEGVKAAGLAGVVVGASRDGALDADALEKMIAAADGMEITLHRVIDTVSDPIAALEIAIGFGFDRVLTSGGAPKAIDGLETLRLMQCVAAKRITVMVGSGVNAGNAMSIAKATGIRAFHASCSRAVNRSSTDKTFGFAPADLRAIDPDEIAALRHVINRLS